MFWNLMPKENISQIERESLSNFILTNDKYTQGALVDQFEKEWSAWQGCKYSVFVNSGSSANLILVKSVMDLYGPGGFISQACTWPTNANPAIQLKGSQFLQLCDNNLQNFGFDLDSLKQLIKANKPKYIFLTHVLGFNGASDELLSLCNENNIVLIEDCCESHGATFKEKKVGNIGLAGTFSFYYGHHITTIEGGMISTNNEELYTQLLLNRSHGFLREHPKKDEIKVSDLLDRRFTFLTDGFNFRNTEINAFLGLMQLKKLDKNIEIRNQNYNSFIKELDPNKYYTNFNSNGISSFAMPIITRKNNTKQLKQNLTEMGIENRPFIAGNLFNQPYLKKVNMFNNFKNADILHSDGMYVGNNQFVDYTMVSKLIDVLNNA
jgi:CDP-6-deoxy-D-xylo-4-hexulose-3-dehydrase